MNKTFYTVLFILISISSFAKDGNTSVEIIKTGVSFGTVLALVISWSRNRSLLWAIIHGILGWFYVIYYALFLPSQSK